LSSGAGWAVNGFYARRLTSKYFQCADYFFEVLLLNVIFVCEK